MSTEYAKKKKITTPMPAKGKRKNNPGKSDPLCPLCPPLKTRLPVGHPESWGAILEDV